jgi:hypothetical protein
VRCQNVSAAAAATTVRGAAATSSRHPVPSSGYIPTEQ